MNHQAMERLKEMVAKWEGQATFQDTSAEALLLCECAEELDSVLEELRGEA